MGHTLAPALRLVRTTTRATRPESRKWPEPRGQRAAEESTQWQEPEEPVPWREPEEQQEDCMKGSWPATVGEGEPRETGAAPLRLRVAC